MRRSSRLAWMLPTIVVLILGPACTHTTLFTTDPAGVSVELDGKPLGTTAEAGLPYTRAWGITDPEGYGLPRQFTLTLKKPGYKPQKVVVDARYHADISLLWILAFVAPYFFTARLEPIYHVVLEPDVPSLLEPDVGPVPGPGPVPDGGPVPVPEPTPPPPPGGPAQ